MTVRNCTGGTKKEKAPPGVFRQAAVSGKRPVLTGRNGESAAARRSGACKNEECSRKAERCIKKAPHEVYLMGGVNPAATYSPGPGGQVPSAI